MILSFVGLLHAGVTCSLVDANLIDRVPRVMPDAIWRGRVFRDHIQILEGVIHPCIQRCGKTDCHVNNAVFNPACQVARVAVGH